MRKKDYIVITGDKDAPDFGTIMDLMDRIEKIGYDEKTAARYARLIGNSPVKDSDGNTVVTENGKELARLKLD